MKYSINLAVHRDGRAHHLAAERDADGLMAETDAEDRNLPGLPHQFDADAGILGNARPRRNHDAFGPHREHFGDRHGVVALDNYLGAEFAQIVPEVVGKAVVIIDQHEHDTTLSL